MWWSLAAAVAALTLLTLMPGPDLAVVTRVALSSGRGAALRTGVGVATGCLLWGLVAVAGLGAVLAASPSLYRAIELAGAAYLIFLGVQTWWRTRVTTSVDDDSPVAVARPFRVGLATNLLNPKIAVFYTSLLPQLVPSADAATRWMAALVLVHGVLGITWFLLYTRLLEGASDVVRRPSVRRRLERLTGTVLIAFGLRVAAHAA